MKTAPKSIKTPAVKKMEPAVTPVRPAKPRSSGMSAIDLIKRRYEALEAQAAAEESRRKAMTYEEVIDSCFPQDLTFLSDRIMYGCLALSGETGEVVEKVKKIIRDKKGHISPDDHVAIIKELGDVLWAVTAIATGLGSNLAEVLAVSKQKFLGRLERGTLQGEGDDR